MAVEPLEAKAHELLNQLGSDQLAAVVRLLEFMVYNEVDTLTDDDCRAIAESREYFRQGNEGLPFEQVVAELGFTMEQIRDKRNA